MGDQAQVILECINISKKFGNVVALKDLSFKVTEGDRKAILGPNGAGKTTLFNIICGNLRPFDGKIFLFGKDVSREPPHTRVQHGFARTFQVTNLFLQMTVIENLFLALHGLSKRKLASWTPFVQRKELIEESEEFLERFSLIHLRDEEVANLSYGDQRLLEIILGMCAKPKILALDEPSSGLSSAETQKLAGILKTLPPELTLLFIEHDMDFVNTVAENVLVLHHGTAIAEGTLEEVKMNPEVQDAYMGGKAE